MQLEDKAGAGPALPGDVVRMPLIVLSRVWLRNVACFVMEEGAGQAVWPGAGQSMFAACGVGRTLPDVILCQYQRD